MSRAWIEAVAALTDVVPLGWLITLLLLAAALVAAGWYWFPAWVPRRLPRLASAGSGWRRPRWPRLRWPRWRWPRWRRRRKEVAPAATEPSPDGGLPDLPVEVFASLADRLAAQGRYAEAVRERLRAMVRELVDLRVIQHRPGWTVSELAAEAGRARPAIDPPLRAAGGLFSELWYGQRTAGPDHDARMRRLAEDLHAELTRDGAR